MDGVILTTALDGVILTTALDGVILTTAMAGVLALAGDGEALSTHLGDGAASMTRSGTMVGVDIMEAIIPATTEELTTDLFIIIGREQMAG